LGSVWFFTGFGSGSCTFFLLSGFGFGSVFAKTWVLVLFVLAGFRFFPVPSLVLPASSVRWRHRAANHVKARDFLSAFGRPPTSDRMTLTLGRLTF